MSKNYDPHESTYIIKDKDGNVKDIAPCYAEEEDSIVRAAREYEEAMKIKKQKEQEQKEEESLER